MFQMTEFEKKRWVEVTKRLKKSGKDLSKINIVPVKESDNFDRK